MFLRPLSFPSVLTGLTAVLLALLVTTTAGPALALARAEVAAQAVDQPATTFRSDRIIVESRGRGPDVILIPGLASSPVIWDRIADRLDDSHRVHLVSVRGFGDAPSGANAAGAVSGAVAQEIDRYILHRRLVRPAVIGHSMGGQIALRLAASAGPRIGRVMTVDSVPFFPALIHENASAGDVEPLARLAFQAVLLLGDDALKRQGAAMGVELGVAGDTVFDSLGWQGGDRRVLAQGLYEVLTQDLRARLPSITAPVTVVYGWSADDRTPRGRVDGLFRSAYRGLRTPARFERIEGAEHMVMIDRPAAFAAAVDRFLR